MGTHLYFLYLIWILGVLGLVGLLIEIVFLSRQRTRISRLAMKMVGAGDPPDIKVWLDTELGSRNHPLRAALDCILAVGTIPNGVLDLVESDHFLVRFISGVRKYAVAVLLLCGIAGTLFSLKSVLQDGGDSLTIHNSKALAEAFLPSISGVIGTLVLMAFRYALLDPAQDRLARELVAFASDTVIPWKQRHGEAGIAVSDAATRLDEATRCFTDATQKSATALDNGATSLTEAFDALSTNMREGCDALLLSLQAAAEQVNAANESAVNGMTAATKQVDDSLTVLAKGLNPVGKWMDKSAKTLSEASDRFDKSVAANGPFLKAMEQLYDSISPAEARYEKLLLAVTELQKLCATQNLELARLYQETAGMGQGILHTAQESTKLASSLQQTVNGLPKISEAVREHGTVLSSSATSWEQVAATLAQQVSQLTTQIQSLGTSHDQTMKQLLQALPAAIANSVASTMQASASRMLKDSHLNDLRTTIDDLRVTMGGIKSLPSSGSKGKRWYQIREWRFIEWTILITLLLGVATYCWFIFK